MWGNAETQVTASALKKPGVLRERVDRRMYTEGDPHARKTWSENAGHAWGSANMALFWLESTDCRKGTIREQGRQ